WCASDRKTDLNHVNSVAWVNGHLWCSCFGPMKGERWSTATDGYIFDVTANQVIKRGIYHPHSLCQYRNATYYCESVHSTFCQLYGYEHTFNGYTRGIAFSSPSQAIIATSLGRKISRSQNLLYGIGNIPDGVVEGECAFHSYDTKRHV